MQLRRECEPLFRDGDYLPLKGHGARAEQACAFARQLGGVMGEQGGVPLVQPVWGDTWIELPAECVQEKWIDVLTDETVVAPVLGEGQGIALAQLFAVFPYALLRPCMSKIAAPVERH